jgi:hypothetical protein
MENLGDIQVLPGQTAQSLTSCFIFCPIWCFNKQSFFINLLARRKWTPIRLPTFTFINQWVSLSLPVHWDLVFGNSPRLWDKIRQSLWDISTLGLDQTMVLMHWLTQFVTYKKKCKLRLNVVYSKLWNVKACKVYVDKCQVGCTGWEWKPHNEQYIAHGHLPLRLGMSSTIHPLLFQGVPFLTALSWIQDFYYERRWIWENVAAKKVETLLPRPSFASSCADCNLQSSIPSFSVHRLSPRKGSKYSWWNFQQECTIPTFKFSSCATISSQLWAGFQFESGYSLPPSTAIFFMNLIVDSVSIEATNIQSTQQIFFHERTQI